jgi:hypothetical protein
MTQRHEAYSLLVDMQAAMEAAEDPFDYPVCPLQLEGS